MKKILPRVLLAVVAVVVAFIIYKAQHHAILPPVATLPPEVVARVPETQPAPPVDVAPHYPVPLEPALPADGAVPLLQDSDQTLGTALAALPGGDVLMRVLNPGEIVRHLVVTIDNLPREMLAVRQLPVRPVGGTFLVTGSADTLAIAPANAARYAAYVRIATSMDTKKLVALYYRFYPLFAQAYRELGYPKGDFNDRLVAVIDHLLLDIPVSTPIRLVQPHVLYTYAQPELQARSAGQKIMLRIGPENAQRLRVTLRALRRELTGSNLNP